MTRPSAPPPPPTLLERRQCLTWGLATASAVMLPALGGCDSPPPSLDKLTIAHAYQASFGLLYVAEKAGFFKEEGLEVQFKRFSFGRETLLATLEGAADIATPFDTPVALSIMDNKPVRVLSSLSMLLGNGQVLGNKRRGIRTPADLKGRHIGFIPNTSGDYILSMVLANAGVAAQEAVLVPVQNPNELAQALIRGDVDAAALWAPITHMVTKEMGDDALVGFTSPTYVETALLTTTEAVLQKNRSAIKKLLSALIKAQNLALRDSARALQYVQSALPDTPPDVVARTWVSLQPQVRLDNQLQTSLENQMTWFLQQRRQQPENLPNVRPHLADEILRAVQPQAVTLKPQR